MKNVKVGDFVNYILDEGYSIGEIRPAVIVRVWSFQPESKYAMVNLQVFVDRENDGFKENVIWKTSVGYSEDFKITRTFHFKED